MIDHVSIAVRDFAAAARFYEAVLGIPGLTKLREWPTPPTPAARNPFERTRCYGRDCSAVAVIASASEPMRP